MKKYDYDYCNFDRMTIIIKSNNEYLLDVYQKCGWNIISSYDDKQYNDIKYYILERKHNIQNKDDINFLQVSYEMNINQISKLNNSKYAKTASLGLSIGLIDIAIVTISIILIVYLFDMFYLIISCLLLILSLIIGIFNFILCNYILEKDKRIINEKIKKIKLENENIIKSVGELYYESK